MPPLQLEMVSILAAACGSRGMAGGQAIDLASVGKALTLPELEHMHIHKTGALIRASVALGARCACDACPRTSWSIWITTPSSSDSRSRWSTTCSIARPRPRRWARPQAKDAAANKPTYVSVLGAGRAPRALAEELRDAGGARGSVWPSCGVGAEAGS